MTPTSSAYRRLRQLHLRRSALARPRLGRGIQTIRTPGSASPDRRRHLSEGTGVPRFHACPHWRERKVRRQSDLALQPRHARTFPRRERPPSLGRRILRAPLPRSPRRRVNQSDSMTRSTASKSSPPMTSKTSRSYGPTACPLTTSPRVPTTSTFASATSSAGRTISRTPTSTCSSSKAPAPNRRSSRIFRCSSRPDGSKLSKRRHGSGGQRHNLSRRWIPSRSLHQLSMSAGMVAKRRSREHGPARN